MPDEVALLYGARPKFGPDYIIPVPFDPRLISTVPPAVAKAAMDTGVARKPIVDMDAYRQQLNARRDPVAGSLVQVFARLRRQPKRVVFAEGEEEQVIHAPVTVEDNLPAAPLADAPPADMVEHRDQMVTRYYRGANGLAARLKSQGRDMPEMLVMGLVDGVSLAEVLRLYRTLSKIKS